MFIISDNQMIVKGFHKKYKYSFSFKHKIIYNIFAKRKAFAVKKIKIGIGGALMLSAMVISDKIWVFLTYLLAALIHEIGHLLAAKMLKIKVDEVKLDFSGARICVDERLTSYRDEFLLSLAGPFANIASIFLILTTYKIIGIQPMVLFDCADIFMMTGDPEIQGMCGFFILSSFIQAFINLLPVKTFDGGRILYCALAGLFSEKVADRVLSSASLLSAFLLWTIALYLMLRISSGIGVYVFSACVFAVTLKDSRFDDYN